MDKNIILISIGDELLSGRTLNTNLYYLSNELNSYGFNIENHFTVHDNKKDIINILDFAFKYVNTVFITGGLGPTPDDITVETIAHYFNKKLIVNKKLYKFIEKIIKNKNKKIIEKLSTVPKGTKLLENKAGVMPGLYIKENKKKVFVLPGVPNEVKSIMDYIKKNYIKKRKNNIYISMRLHGIFESEVMNILKEKLDKKLFENIAFLPSYGYVDLLLYENKFTSDNIKKIKKVVNELFKFHIINTKKTLIEYIQDYFIKNQITLSTSESCTGGLLGKRLTDISGSSKYFIGGTIVYSNELKMKLLKVKKSTIEKYGAVSEETAYEMANNTKKIMKSDYAISITGIAGPTGGTKNKPVGLVYIGIASPKNIKIYKCKFNGNRDVIRKFTLYYSLYYLYRSLI